ncbi:MAG: beta-ketoacyl synthase N-terminal-like domain-containing protein [Puia sp.]|nr:beta-ketoacyl synthase N-terminal-like domain-containing protein [Puia sp.]
MTDVFIVSDNILSPLGRTTAANFSQLAKGMSGVKKQVDTKMSAQPFYASLFDREDRFMTDDGGATQTAAGSPGEYTRFERLLIASVRDAVQTGGIDTRDPKMILIVSSTKGNIDLLGTMDKGERDLFKKRVALYTSADLVAEYFGFVNPPVVVSTACISGIAAVLTGMRFIRSGRYETAVIAGADTVSRFVLSGFQSFQAISPGHCKPFDLARDGINLGEGAGTLVLSSREKYSGGIKILSGSISNDANHLSAPSRTGAELCASITNALRGGGLSASDVDFISAHGTATIYNDEMEAKALTLSNLQSVPVNSLKGYYGHTLGAAGLIETIISVQSLKKDLVLPTLGFEEMGVTDPLNICTGLLSAPLKNCLKTASGFGGCNAALVFSKQ